MRAKFPALGSTKRVPFVADAAPTPKPDEDAPSFERRCAYHAALKDAWIEVRLVSRDVIIDLENRFALEALTEAKRQRSAIEAGTHTGMTLEGIKALEGLHRDAVKLLVKSIGGIDVGDVPLEDAQEAGLLGDLLTAAGLLADTSAIARNAQRPMPSQLER